MASEIELKLDVTKAQLKGLKRAPWLMRYVSGPGQESQLNSVYYDTDNLALRRQRACLRVREADGAHTQTFKAENRGPYAGLKRLEWECALDGARPNLEHAQKKKTGGVNLKKLAGSLKPVFETSVRRHTLALLYRGSQLELALDCGEIKTGRRRTPIHEVEVELKRGKAADVISLGRELAKKLDAAYGIASKAERGYALREDETEAPVCAQPIGLSEKMAATEAFRAIAMSCLHHLASNRPAVVAGKAEGIHQMRVGLRRLRAAISVFKEMLRGPETEGIKGSLKWLTEELGPARDMDVLAKEAIAPLAEKASLPMAIASLKRDVIAKRDKGFERAKRAATSDRYRRLILDTVLWINGGRWTKSHVPLIAARRCIRADRFAAQELGRRTRKVIKKLAKIDDLNPRKRHKLRIAVKKLRYAIGYFENLFEDEKKTIRKLSGVLEDLQCLLGRLNDIRVHLRLAKDYAASRLRTERAAGQAFAMGELTGEEKAESRKLLKATKHRGKRLESCPLFWESKRKS